ncbi:hypothetical protein SK128_023685 [Halocaridina rubra]|uniref:Chitin-binding type-2 domain-containing protein n=1 Tax=Halocaridina rubra TaxID=373956 RepID=A0AAN9AAE5_HALRR
MRIALVGLTYGQDSPAPGNGEAPAELEPNATETTTAKPKLTGNPQIDYIHDPNLPHEVRGYNLSDYPFYARLPEDLLEPTFNFTCDNRHDGFYASVPHKCQVYHNCLFGQRYDFLCANYTVFDQKNFICHYVSEVDCKNSALHYDRNEELYETTTTTTTTQAPPQVIYIERPRPLQGPGIFRPNRPRPFKNRRPGNRRTTTTQAPEYYDDYYYDDYYDYYYDEYVNERSTTTTTTTTQRPRRPNRPQGTRLRGGEGRPRPSGRFGNIHNAGVRKRPRINAPVPLDAEIGNDAPRASRLQESSSPRHQAVVDVPADETPQDTIRETPSGLRSSRPGRKPRPGGRLKKKPTTTTTTTETAPNDDYYYDYYEYENEPSSTAAPVRPSLSRTRPSLSRPQQNRRQPTTTTTTTTELPVTESTGSRPTRPNRINIRRNPVGGRDTPVEDAVPLDELPTPLTILETEPRRPPSQRNRPQFPRRRTQVESGIEEQDTVVFQEEAPLAPGLELSPDGNPIDADAPDSVRQPAGEAPTRPNFGSQAPLRRIGPSGNRRSGFQVRGSHSRTTSDYSDY